MSNVIKATAELEELWREEFFLTFTPSTSIEAALKVWAERYPGTTPRIRAESFAPRLLLLGPAPRREISESPNGPEPKPEPEGEPTVSFTVAAAADIGLWSDPGWEPDEGYPKEYKTVIRSAQYRRRGRGYQWVFTNVPLPIAEFIANELEYEEDKFRVNSRWSPENQAAAGAYRRAIAAIHRAIGEAA